MHFCNFRGKISEFIVCMQDCGALAALSLMRAMHVALAVAHKQGLRCPRWFDACDCCTAAAERRRLLRAHRMPSTALERSTVRLMRCSVSWMRDCAMSSSRTFCAATPLSSFCQARPLGSFCTAVHLSSFCMARPLSTCCMARALGSDACQRPSLCRPLISSMARSFPGARQGCAARSESSWKLWDGNHPYISRGSALCVWQVWCRSALRCGSAVCNQRTDCGSLTAAYLADALRELCGAVDAPGQALCIRQQALQGLQSMISGQPMQARWPVGLWRLHAQDEQTCPG